MHTSYRVCSRLKSSERCFRLFEYNDGEFVELFHEHVPNHRISSDEAFQFTRALLIKYSALGDREILRTFVNNRSGNPEKIQLIVGHTEFPEAGVFRRYFNSSPYMAWIDEVTDKSRFRVQSEG